MYLTYRSLWLILIGLIPAFLIPRTTTIAIWVGCVGLCVVLDVVLAPSPHAMEFARLAPPSVRLGETTTSTLLVKNTGRRRVRGTVRNAWQPSAGAASTYSQLDLRAGQQRKIRTSLTPTRRGDRHADLVTVRLVGPLGLAGRQRSFFAPAAVRVLPAFVSRKHLPSKLSRLREIDGRSAVMIRGQGTEFDSLRQYVIGDDVRSIDWRSTARRGEVVVRTWRPERDRRVLILIDSGRLAAVRLDNAPRFEAEIEAALLLAALASHAGDRVDVIVLDDVVRTQVHEARGSALMAALAARLAPLDPQLVELRWSLVSQVAHERMHGHGLFVILTAVDPTTADFTLVRSLRQLTSQRTVLIVSALDPGLHELRLKRATTEDLYIAAAAERTLLELDATRALLRREGAEVIEASPDMLAPATADAYLALKAAGRL